MNIHPIIVHFPVALLTLYAIFELARFSFLTRQEYWFYVKASLLILGSLSSFLALATGDTAKAVGGFKGSKVVEMHETFAGITGWIFGLLAFAYLIAWANRANLFMKFRASTPIATAWSFATQISRFLLKSWVVIPLSLLGLCTVVITAGLGGALVYGLKFDPFMAPIFRLLGLMA